MTKNPKLSELRKSQNKENSSRVRKQSQTLSESLRSGKITNPMRRLSKESRSKFVERMRNNPMKNPKYVQKMVESQKFLRETEMFKKPVWTDGGLKGFQKKWKNWYDNGGRAILSEAAKKQWIDSERREKLSLKAKERWASGFYNKYLSLMGGNIKRPNNKEIFLQSILDELSPGEYRYNDGWFILDGKIPDFVNTNGQKKLIEFFGRHWHESDDEKRRVENFKKFGYNCLVIWEEELETCQHKVKKFMESD